MKQLIHRLLVIPFAAAALIVTPGAAHAYSSVCDTPAASSTRLVFVENHARSGWPVWCAQNYVDRYTGTNVIYGACRSGYRCVHVYEKYRQSDLAAYTVRWYSNGTYTGNADIYLNPYRYGYSWSYKIRVITHELGHAFGNGHSDGCNLMHATVYCNGSLTGYYFTSTQKSTLARY